MWPRVCLCVHMCLCAFNDRVWKPRTELCKQIIRKQDCVFVYVRVCVPLTIEYWTQGIITHRNSTGQIRIRECSSLEQNWSIEAKDRTVQTNNQNPRLCQSMYLCVYMCLCAFNDRLLDPRNNNPQKQYSSDYNQRMFKPRTEMEYWSQEQNCAASRLEIENYYWTQKQKPNTVQIRPELDIKET